MCILTVRMLEYLIFLVWLELGRIDLQHTEFVLPFEQ